MAYFWRLVRNQATRVIPPECTTERVWIPAYNPPGGSSETAEFCSWVTKTVRVPVWIFIPDDDDESNDEFGETSGTGTYVGNTPPSRSDGIWVIAGYRNVEERVRECVDTQQQDGPDSPEPGNGSGGGGHYETAEVCTEAREELYLPQDWAEVCLSNSALSGSGDYTFKVSRQSNILTGLGDATPTVDDWGSIEHGFYIYRAGSNFVRIIENRQYKTGAIVLANDATLKVERTKFEVKYYINSTLVYTSKTPSQGPKYAHGFLYTITDEIHDAAFTNRNTGEVDTSFQVFDADAIETPGIYVYAVATPFDAEAEKPIEGSVDTELMPFAAFATPLDDFAGVDASITPFDSTAYEAEDPAPDVVWCDAAATAFDAQAYGLNGQTGSVDASMLPFAAQAWDVDNLAFVDTTMMSFDAEAIEYDLLEDLNYLHAEWFPIATLEASGESSTENSFEATVTLWELDAWGGQHGLVEELTLWSLDATGAANRYGELDETVTLWELDATGTAGRYGSLSESLTLWALDAYEGPTLNESLTLWGLAATGAQSWDAQLDETVTLWTLDAEGDYRRTAQLDETVTLWGLEAGDSGGVLSETLTLFNLTASSTTTSSVTYAVNLTNNAVTRYTEGYRRFLRVNGKHYAIGHDDVLYLLEGDTRDGDTITGHVLTHPSDFGASNKKRVVKGYVDARGGGTLYAGLVADEETRSYPAAIEAGTGGQNHPFKPGRGLVGQRFAVEFQTSEDTEVAGVELLVQPLSRKVY